jgi:hypothetical protein
MSSEVKSLDSPRRRWTGNSSHNLLVTEKAEQCTSQLKEISGILDWDDAIESVSDILVAYFPSGWSGFGRVNEGHHQLTF